MPSAAARSRAWRWSRRAWPACVALDPKIQAWAHLDAEGALAAARERDAESAAGRSRGSLHGVPMGIKDIIDVAGMPTTAGARAFAHTRPTRDATRRGAPACRGRRDRRQGAHHAVRLSRSGADPEPVEPRAHAGRLVVRLGGGRRRPHGAVRARLADGRLDSASGRVLRRGRVQGPARPGAGRRRRARSRGRSITSVPFARSVGRRRPRRSACWPVATSSRRRYRRRAWPSAASSSSAPSRPARSISTPS